MEKIVQDVNVREICSISLLKNKGLFDSKKYIDLSGEELSKINFNSMKNDDNSVICDVVNNIAYENCALKENNPYLKFYYNSNNPVCSTPVDMKIHDSGYYKFDYDTNSNIIKPISDIYFKNKKEAYCEERWSDWFCIPNFHLGNKWYNNNPNDLENTKSVGKCYMPCSIGYIPADENNTKCVLKKTYSGGIYSYDFDYTPLALICLLGTTFDNFKDENCGYIKFLKDKKISIEKDTNIELLRNENGEDIIENVLKNIRVDQNVLWEDIKTDISRYINEIFTNIPDLNDEFIKLNIKVPDENIKKRMQNYITEYNILYAYKIAEKLSLCQKPEKNDMYSEFRYKLQLISNLKEDKFRILLKVLKKCCNICFDEKSDFSKRYLLYSINKGETEYKPITIDVNYDIVDEKYKLNKFEAIKLKKTKLYGEYDNSFKLWDNFMYYYMRLLIIIYVFYILYIIYVYKYTFFTSILNTIIKFVVFRYYDIVYYMRYIYLYIFDRFSIIDDRELKQADYILNSLKNLHGADVK